MRIIAGEAKGRRIQTPEGFATRPTLDRVRESLFGIIQLRIPGARVLDLYAGSGGLGLEALSRGAAGAVFVDSNRSCCALINKNAETLGFASRVEILHTDALAALNRLSGRFDIVFLDPPYQMPVSEPLAALFQNELIAEDGLAAAEHEYASPPGDIPGLMRCIDRRRYGKTGLSFFVGGA